MSNNAVLPLVLLIGLGVAIPVIVRDKSESSSARTAKSTASNASAKSLSVRPTVRLSEFGEKSPAVVRIQKALKSPVKVKFHDVTIREALDRLAAQSGIELLVDQKTCINEGIDLDSEQITYQFTGTSLAAVLDNIFKNRNLVWMIHNEVLWVTTESGAEAIVESRIYDVADLVRHVTHSGQVQVDFESLVSAIENGVVGPWESVNGQGGIISTLDTDGIDVLVVQCNPRCHDRVENFLAGIRSMRRGAGDFAGNRHLPKPLTPVAGSEIAAKVLRLLPPNEEALKSIVPLVESTSHFATDFYARLATSSDENVCCSPYSVSTAMMMLLAGAKNDSAKQIREVLHLSAPSGQEQTPEFHEQARLLQRHLMPTVESPDFKLKIANRIWAQEGHRILDSFRALTKEKYDSDVGFVDIIGNRDAARNTINGWVKNRTDSLIPELLSNDDLGPLTRLVLTNALLFEAHWDSPFAETDTKDREFDTGKKKLVVPTMAKLAYFRYAESDGKQIVDLPYRDMKVSMWILLPQPGVEKLASLERSLTAEELEKWATALELNRVHVQLPKFQFRTHLELREILQTLGMKDPFKQPISDLSGIDGVPSGRLDSLYVEKAIHETYIDVDEKGTKAAAATALVGGIGGGPPRETEPIEFVADHPFLFLIRENETGCILFMGRVTNPARR